jgi:CheY-like chemotaxis protein
MANVLLVMSRRGNTRVMTEVLEGIGHTTVGISDYDALTTVLAQPDSSRVAVVDISGFGPEAWRLCQALHRHDIRFVVLCTAQEIRSGAQALAHGAASFLQKPVRKPALLQLLSGLERKTAAAMLT